MRRWRILIITCIFLCITNLGKAQVSNEFHFKAPSLHSSQKLRLRTDAIPWLAAIPNIGAEYVAGKKWSAVIDLWYAPWKISDKFSIKTVALLPEARWWLKNNTKGSFFNIHLNIAWFNVRANHNRYQDYGRPLLGAGIGYGYHMEIAKRWGLEFEIGAGMANMKYQRFYNVPNGALKDTRVSTYWGIDRASITFTYLLCEL